MARFSVITATYDLIDGGRKDSFLKAVASVRAQTHADIEHIVVDGASTDGTTEMLNQMLADGLFDTLISEPDQGAYDAMNRGVDAATGEFIVVLNSDDLFHDADVFHKLDQMQYLQNLEFIASPVLYTGSSGQTTRRVSRGFSRVLLTMPFGYSGLVMRRKLFLDLGGFDLNFKIASDYDLVLRMLLAGAKGGVLKTAFVTFAEGGLSADISALDAEKVSIWMKIYLPYADLPRAEWERAMARRIVPAKLCFAMLLDPALPFVIRRSALVQLGRALLKGSA